LAHPFDNKNVIRGFISFPFFLWQFSGSLKRG
jgi:hypothetical protein